MKSDARVRSGSDVPAWAQKVHVVGIGGSGLRGMVQLLNQRGSQVSGSEMAESPVLDRLRSINIDCRVGHDEMNLAKGVKLVVVSAAVDASNPEVKAARSRSIPVWKYAQCLGRLMAEKNGIAVAGTHGKTTTTAMIAQVLESARLDPSFLIGGDYPGLGGSARWGSGPHFVAEACEYDRSFLNLTPHAAIVTNVDEDHVDYFDSLKDIRKAFGDFVGRLPTDGLLVLNHDDPSSRYLRDLSRSHVVSCSLRPRVGDWWAEELNHFGIGCRFIAVHSSGERFMVQLSVPGRHNARNALSAIAICRAMGVSLGDISEGLEAFTGVRRRFDILARGPVVVVDDYAHHPTEIKAVLSAARSRFPLHRLVAVFQPHQHSRLKRFREDFAAVLSGFDRVLVMDVFRARDSDEDARLVRSDSLVELLTARGASVASSPQLEDGLCELLREVSRDGGTDGDHPGTAVIFMGAGDITELAKYFAAHVKKGTFQDESLKAATTQASRSRVLSA